MYIGYSIEIHCWQDMLCYLLKDAPYHEKTIVKENIHKVSALVYQAMRKAAPGTGEDDLIANIEKVIAKAINTDGSIPLEKLLHPEDSEKEQDTVKGAKSVKGTKPVSETATVSETAAVKETAAVSETATVKAVKAVKHKFANLLNVLQWGNHVSPEAVDNEQLTVKHTMASTQNVGTHPGASAAATLDTEKVTVKAVKDTAKNSVKDTAKDSVKDTLMSKLKTFFAANYAFRYNILTRESEMKPLNAANGNDAQQYTVIGKREENTLVISAQEAGINCWDADVKRLINSSNTAEYHPFVEYFNTLPKWDGKDRVSELARRVSDKELWVSSFHRWMLALTAQWMNYRTESSRANCVAPLLISTEQGWGKSTFCRMIMPSPLRRYYTESFDLASQSSCEAKLADFGLINLDEFDKITAKKMPTLKNLMQEQALNIKRAYQQGTTPLHRIASFIGTSNSRDLLTDRSGSRRFICVELEKEIDCETPIDYAQLYAQLKEEVTVKHERTYFTKEEERKIQEGNRLYYHTSVEEELFYRHFRFAERTDENARFMTASEIFKHLKREDGALLHGVTTAQFARLLPGIGQRVHTKLGNGYFVEVLKEE